MYLSWRSLFIYEETLHGIEDRCRIMCVFSCRMPFHFCPQCGSKLQPDFRFCPSCGEKLPCPVDVSGPVCTSASLSLSSLKSDDATTSVVKTSSSCDPTESKSHYLCGYYSLWLSIDIFYVCKLRKRLPFMYHLRYNFSSSCTSKDPQLPPSGQGS